MYIYAYQYAQMFEGLNNLHIYVPTCIISNVFYSLQQKHQIVEREIEGRRPHFQTVCQNGEKLKSEAVHASKAIGLRIITLQERWKKLNELCTNRRQRLEEGTQLQQASECVVISFIYMYVFKKKLS